MITVLILFKVSHFYGRFNGFTFYYNKVFYFCIVLGLIRNIPGTIQLYKYYILAKVKFLFMKLINK